MKTCIICRKGLPESQFGAEHVVPDALGGTLVIQDVCTPCNSFLGHKVDTHLANHPLAQLARLELGLTGRDGGLKHPLQEGVLKDDPGQAVTLEFGSHGAPQIYFFPRVDRKKCDGEEEKVRVSVDPSEISKLPGIVNKILRRKGLPEKTSAEILQHARNRRIETPTTVHNFDVVHGQYQLALLKIAYEFTYHCLGQIYLKDIVGQAINRAIQDVPITRKWYHKHTIEGMSEIVEISEEGIGTTHELSLTPHSARLLCNVSILGLFRAKIFTTNCAYTGSGFTGKAMIIDAVTGERTELP